MSCASFQKGQNQSFEDLLRDQCLFQEGKARLEFPEGKFLIPYSMKWKIQEVSNYDWWLVIEVPLRGEDHFHLKKKGSNNKVEGSLFAAFRSLAKKKEGIGVSQSDLINGLTSMTQLVSSAQKNSFRKFCTNESCKFSGNRKIILKSLPKGGFLASYKLKESPGELTWTWLSDSRSWIEFGKGNKSRVIQFFVKNCHDDQMHK